jgi:hypothetical protein
MGVEFDCVAWQLENEGVQKFIDPLDQLIKMRAAGFTALRHFVARQRPLQSLRAISKKPASATWFCSPWVA